MTRTAIPLPEPPPPLQNGDRLSRIEFERRYAAMPESFRAELIEGVVFVSSAVRHDHHGRPHAFLGTWLGNYEAATPGVQTSTDTTVRLDLDNAPQPDALLRVESGRDGATIVSKDGYLEGPPELVVGARGVLRAAGRLLIPRFSRRREPVDQSAEAQHDHGQHRYHHRTLDPFALFATRVRHYVRILPKKTTPKEPKKIGGSQAAKIGWR